MGEWGRRSGLKLIPWKPRAWRKRFKAWWTDEPQMVNQLIEFEGYVWAATDRGLYYVDKDMMVLKPVPFAEDTPNAKE